MTGKDGKHINPASKSSKIFDKGLRANLSRKLKTSHWFSVGFCGIDFGNVLAWKHTHQLNSSMIFLIWNNIFRWEFKVQILGAGQHFPRDFLFIRGLPNKVGIPSRLFTDGPGAFGKFEAILNMLEKNYNRLFSIFNLSSAFKTLNNFDQLLCLLNSHWFSCELYLVNFLFYKGVAK